MRFTVAQHHFARGLSVVSHAIDRSASQPIQAYILATTDGRRIRLTAMSEEMGIHYWIPAEHIAEQGTTLLPARLTSDMVSNLPNCPVTVTTPSPTDPACCHIQCQRISTFLSNGGQDPEEFPRIPVFGEEGSPLLLLDAELLKQIIGQVVFAAARKDTSGRALTGLRIEVSDGLATFVAADSYRLAMRSLPIPDQFLRFELLLPAHTLASLAKLLPETGTVQMVVMPGHNQVLFHTDTMDLYCQQLIGTYPDWRRVLPQHWTTRAVVSTRELEAMVRLLMPFAKAEQSHLGSQVMFLQLSGSQETDTATDSEAVTLEATARDLGSNVSVVSAQVSGPDQRVMLQVDALASILSVIEEAEVAFEITSPNRPIVVKPVGATNFLSLLMPLLYTPQPTPSQEAPEQAASIPVEVTS